MKKVLFQSNLKSIQIIEIEQNKLHLPTFFLILLIERKYAKSTSLRMH